MTFSSTPAHRTNDLITAGPSFVVLTAGPLAGLGTWLIVLGIDRLRSGQKPVIGRHALSAAVLTLALMAAFFFNQIALGISPRNQVEVDAPVRSTIAYLDNPRNDPAHAILLRIVWRNEYKRTIASTFASLANEGVLGGAVHLRQGMRRIEKIDSLSTAIELATFGYTFEARQQAKKTALDVLGQLSPIPTARGPWAGVIFGPAT